MGLIMWHKDLKGFKVKETWDTLKYEFIRLKLGRFALNLVRIL